MNIKADIMSQAKDAIEIREKQRKEQLSFIEEDLGFVKKHFDSERNALETIQRMKSTLERIEVLTYEKIAISELLVD